MTTAYFYLHVIICGLFHFFSKAMTLSISKLSKRFNNEWILKDVEMNVGTGSVVGIVGRKGSGKTTLLRILAGLENSNGGIVKLADDPIGGNTSFVPATPASGFLHRAFTKTEDTIDTAKRQADAIDGALSGKAEILLFDDVFNFFDPLEIQASVKKIRETIKGSGRVAIIAFDDFNEVYDLCDTVAVLNDGRIMQTGPPCELYDNPCSRAVAEITGDNNLIDARRLSSSKADLPEFQTLIGEHRLYSHKCELAKLGAINQTVSLAVRPEHISLSFGASFPEDNLLKATITDVVFKGPTTMVGLDSNGLKLNALVLRLVGLNIGDECMVGLPPDRINILPE